ncbi:MAG TPA: cytochrome c3 family protein [Polyangiaceae bacterium]
MRGIAFACIAALCLGLSAAVAACSEHFPALPDEAGVEAAPPAEAGPVEADASPLESAPPAQIPASQRVSASSSRVIWDVERSGVWVANGDVGTIAFVDPNGRTLVGEVAVGQDATSVALSPDGAWIAAVDRAGGTVSLVDPDARVVRRTLSVGNHPRSCVWDAADPRWLYVAVEDDANVTIVDRTLGVVAATIPVMRLPSGLAVSATASQLLVSHRIDGDVTVIDTSARVVTTDVPLADEPYSDPTTPNGKPFAFEAPAYTFIGHHAWIPHELLAPVHPFVFDQTLFPAISVVDTQLLVEQPTDPNSANIDGRKNLFDAIDVIGPDGQPDVFSQPCAVAMHPNGLVAWALACASEDLLVFDVTQGIAIDAVRDIPGDHPVGLALDDTGQRVFVLSDQSHTLTTFDTDGGVLIGHTRIYGDPIPTAANDPVDAQLRAGLELFFSANPSKGPLTTTNDDWMSCAGCHLDGFGPTNARLFEALVPHDPATDAQIGHAGLKDFFSTTNDAGGASLDPHDLLVAVEEQGGLVPVASDGGGPVDPGAPTPDAITMAQRLAAVVARDLAVQPAWTREVGGVPNTAWDAEYCGSCHPSEYAAWKTSVHAHAGEDPMMLYCSGNEQGIVGPPFGKLCVGCHDPVGARTGDFSLQAKRGVTCIGCHDVTLPLQSGGNGGLQATPHDWSVDHKAWAEASLATLRQPTFCEGCHQQFVPGTGLLAIDTLGEYDRGPYAGQTLCVDCHMPKVDGVADHHAAGGNVYLGQLFGDPTLVQEQTAHVQEVLSVSAVRVAGGVEVTLGNVGAGHGFPTGVTDIKQAWVEIHQQGVDGGTLATYGGLDDAGSLPLSSARLGIDIAGVDGGLLLHHELSSAARVPFDVRIPPGEAQSLFVPVPDGAPGPLEAVVVFGVVRGSYYRAAVGDPGAVAPTLEMAHAEVR